MLLLNIWIKLQLWLQKNSRVDNKFLLTFKDYRLQLLKLHCITSKKLDNTLILG